MPIALNGSTSGKVTVQAPAVAGTNTLTLPATTGNLISSADTGTVTQTMLGSNVAGNGPAFSAYLTANQTVTNLTWTKVTLNSKEFDTNSNFDAVTNYRFTPTVAGYYQINWQIYGYGTTNTTQTIAAIYKNGSVFKYGSTVSQGTAGGSVACSGSNLMYFNGSTDYIELYAFVSASGTPTIGLGPTQSYMSGYLARSA